MDYFILIYIDFVHSFYDSDFSLLLSCFDFPSLGLELVEPMNFLSRNPAEVWSVWATARRLFLIVALKESFNTAERKATITALDDLPRSLRYNFNEPPGTMSENRFFKKWTTSSCGSVRLFCPVWAECKWFPALKKIQAVTSDSADWILK